MLLSSSYEESRRRPVKVINGTEGGLGKRLRETFTGAIGDFAVLKYFLNLRDSISLWSLVTKGLVFREVLVDIDKVNRQLERLWTSSQDAGDPLTHLPPICLKFGKIRKLQLSVSIARGATTVCIGGLDAVLSFAPRHGSSLALTEESLPRFVSNLGSVQALLKAVLDRHTTADVSSTDGWKQSAINFWLKYDPRISLRVKDVHICLEDDANIIGRWGFTASSIVVRTRDAPRSTSQPGIKDAKLELLSEGSRLYYSRHARPFSELTMLSVPFDAVNVCKREQLYIALDGALSRPTRTTDAQAVDPLKKSLTESPGYIERFLVSINFTGSVEVCFSADVLAAMSKLAQKLRLSSAAASLKLPFGICEPFKTTKRQWKWLRECLLLSRRKRSRSTEDSTRDFSSDDPSSQGSFDAPTLLSPLRSPVRRPHQGPSRCSRHQAMVRKANRIVLQNMKLVWCQTILGKIQNERSKEVALEEFIKLVKRISSNEDRVATNFGAGGGCTGCDTAMAVRPRPSERPPTRLQTISRMGSSLARMLSSSFPNRQSLHEPQLPLPPPLPQGPRTSTLIDGVVGSFLTPPLKKSDLEILFSRLPQPIALSLVAHSDKSAVAQCALVGLWEVAYTLRILFDALRKLKSTQALTEFAQGVHRNRAVLSDVDFAVWTALNKPTRIVSCNMPATSPFPPTALIHIWASFLDEAKTCSKDRLDLLVHSCVHFFDSSPPLTVAWKPSIIKPPSGDSTRYSERVLLGNRLLLRSLVAKKIRPHLKPTQRLVEFDLMKSPDLALALRPSEIAACILYRARRSTPLLTERSDFLSDRRVSPERPDSFLKEAEQMLKRARAFWAPTDVSELSSCPADDDTIGTSCRTVPLKPCIPAPAQINNKFKPFVLRSAVCGSTSIRLRFNTLTILTGVGRTETRIEVGTLVASANMDRKLTATMAIRALSGSVQTMSSNHSFFIGRSLQNASATRPGGPMLSNQQDATANDRLAVTMRLTLTPANSGKIRTLELAPPLALSLTVSINDITHNDEQIICLSTWVFDLFRSRWEFPIILPRSITSRLKDLCLGSTAARNGFFRIRVRLPNISSSNQQSLVTGRRIAVDTGRISGVRAYRVSLDEAQETTIPQGEEGLKLVLSILNSYLDQYSAEEVENKKFSTDL